MHRRQQDPFLRIRPLGLCPSSRQPQPWESVQTPALRDQRCLAGFHAQERLRSDLRSGPEAVVLLVCLRPQHGPHGFSQQPHMWSLRPYIRGGKTPATHPEDANQGSGVDTLKDVWEGFSQVYFWLNLSLALGPQQLSPGVSVPLTNVKHVSRVSAEGLISFRSDRL